MKTRQPDPRRQILTQARHSLRIHHLPRIRACLRLLAEQDIWWRPHWTSNSVGNLALHLSGNVRQWIICGLGGATDRRERDKEFAERGPVPRRALIGALEKTVREACRVLAGLPAPELARVRVIQGFRVTGFQAIAHVVEHFAYHTGQIIYVTKLKLRRDLGFTRLPRETRKRPPAQNFPAI